MVKNKKSKLIIISLSITALIVAVGGYYLKFGSNSDKAPPPITRPNGVNLNPPTKQEQKAGNEAKQRLKDREEAIKNLPPTAAGSKKSVAPFIVYAGQSGDQVEVRAYLTGVFEDGGTCTAVFTKDYATITKPSTARRNVSTVDCAPITAGSSEFLPKGTWNVRVAYDSATAAGTSETQTLEVK